MFSIQMEWFSVIIYQKLAHSLIDFHLGTDN